MVRRVLPTSDTSSIAPRKGTPPQVRPHCLWRLLHPPSHSGHTKGTHRGLRRKSSPTKNIVDHEQRGREHGGIGLDGEPSRGITRLQIAARQAHNPVRPQTETRAA